MEDPLLFVVSLCLGSEKSNVPRASAANVSIIKLTHRSWTAVNTDSSSPLATAEINVRRTAVMLTVIWNCAN